MKSIYLSVSLAAGIASQDPMMLAYNYAYTRAICDSATPKERKVQGRTDATINCAQAQAFKKELKAIGRWCVTNSAADIGVPCAGVRQ